MDKTSKLKNSTAIPPQKKILRNPVVIKPSSTEVKPRIQRLCTISGIPAKNPIPHVPAQHSFPIPLEPPKTKVVYSQTSDTDRKGSWESILAAQTKGASKSRKNSVPSLLLTNSSPRSPMLNYDHSNQHSRNIHDVMPHSINFHNFDPIRTLQFLTLELKSRIKMHLPDEMNLYRIVGEIQQTIKRLSTVSTSTAIVETTSMAGGDDRRMIREDLHSFGDSVSGQFALSVNNHRKYKNQTVQTENIEPPQPILVNRADNTDSRHSLKDVIEANKVLEVSNVKLQHEVSKYHDELQSLRKREHKLESYRKYKNQIMQTENIEPPQPILISRADNTDSRHSLKEVIEGNKVLEVSNVKLQHEVSKYHDELHNLRKREHKLENLLKSRDKQVNRLQKELTDIETLVRDQIKLLHKDKIYIDFKNDGESSGDRNKKINSNDLNDQKLLNNISTSTSLTNVPNSVRLENQNELYDPLTKHNNIEYEKLFTKPQLISPGNSPPTLIPPRVSLSIENYKAGKEKNRRYSENLNDKGGFYHEDIYGDNDDDIIRSKKKLATATLNHDDEKTKNLKDINLNMDEIKAIFNDVKLPSPPRKFQQELPSFM